MNELFFGNDGAPSDNPAPTVVDSPLPQTANGTNPPETGAVPGTNSAAAEGNTVEQPNRLEELSQQFGVDLTGFSSEKDALAAVRLQAERFAQAGIQPAFDYGQSYDQSQQVIPVQPAAEVEPTFDFGDDADPKIVAAFKALHKQNQDAIKEAKAVREQLDRSQKQQVTRWHQEVTHRAQITVDKLASPKYGVTGKRTLQQEFAVENLNRIAGSLINGYLRSGTPSPTIESIIQHAVLLDGGFESGQSSAATNPGTTTGHSLQPRQGGSVPNAGVATLPNVARAHDPLGLLNDPSYIAGVKKIMSSSK